MTDSGAVPRLLFAAAAATAAAVLLILAHPLTFFLDEWDFLLDRREWTAHVFLEPHNEHISILPVAVYKLLVTAFGMDSQTPFQVALTAIVVLNGTLVFAWCRRRVGDWLALAMALPLLFLGSSAFDLIWPFQVTMMGSMAFGLGALVALDREDRFGDRLACALLVGSLATHSPGIAFTAGVAAGVLVRPDRRQRAYIVLIPAALYLLWWLVWGVSPDGLTAGRALHAPIYVLNGFASSLASLLGAVVGLDGNPIDPLRWGRVFLVIAIAAAGWRMWRVRRVTASLATVLGTGLAFWTLSALAGGAGREPTNGRYQYLGAVFVILIAAELWRGARPGRAGIAVALAVSGVAVAGNLRAFDAPRDFLRASAGVTRARLAAAEIAGPGADPDAEPVPAARLAPYLGAVEEYGSPALDVRDLANAVEPDRVLVDQELAELYGLHAAEDAARRDERCIRVPPGAPSTVRVAPGRGAIVEPHAPTALALRRYAEEQFPVDLGTVPAGPPVQITFPGDGSDVPWTLAITSEEPTRACAADDGP